MQATELRVRDRDVIGLAEVVDADLPVGLDVEVDPGLGRKGRQFRQVAQQRFLEAGGFGRQRPGLGGERSGIESQ